MTEAFVQLQGSERDGDWVAVVNVVTFFAAAKNKATTVASLTIQDQNGDQN
jgi:hypothetical protein